MILEAQLYRKKSNRAVDRILSVHLLVSCSSAVG